VDPAIIQATEKPEKKRDDWSKGSKIKKSDDTEKPLEKE